MRVALLRAGAREERMDENVRAQNGKGRHRTGLLRFSG
jgi:hypothetical protein